MVLLNLLKAIGIILLVVVSAFAPLFGLYYLIKNAVGFFNKSIYGKKIDIKYAELLLSSRFPYYRKLDQYHRTKFLRRLLEFIDNKDFIGSGGLTVNDEMIILISASAIQLTFGLKEFGLDHFSKIFIYPKAFFSKISKQYHKGETNLAGAIALSWSDFADGLNKPHDKINLGLHEMAHALRFDKFKSEDYDRFFSKYYDKWHMIALKEFKKIQGNPNSFFREYGGTNFDEFFAVCVEIFFETPAEFKKLYPDIYNHLSILLNQDPLRLTDPEDLRKTHDPAFIPSGDVFYQTKINIKNFVSLLFVTGVWFVLLTRSFDNGFSADFFFLVFGLLALGYFIARNGFSKILFYQNGMAIKTLLPYLKKKQSNFRYDEVVAIEFNRRSQDETNDTVKIMFLEEGKIKSRTFTDDFSRDEVIKFADFLVDKKIAVKLNSFAKK
jgi:Mlc titration factor MtfA (ptsG expression regulator)